MAFRNGQQRSAEANDHRVGTTAKQVAEHASAITRLELELAALELKRKAVSLGVGAGLAVVAVLLVLLAIVFAFATAAAAIATATPVWLALLIVAGALMLFAGLLGTVALARLRRGASLPNEAIGQAKLTAKALRR